MRRSHTHMLSIFSLSHTNARAQKPHPHTKSMVSLMVGDELLLAFDRFKENVDFFLKVTRCLGSLSLVDECVVNMCVRNGVWITVSGMKLHMDSPEALKVAIELLSNFAACEDDALDAQCTWGGGGGRGCRGGGVWTTTDDRRQLPPRAFTLPLLPTTADDHHHRRRCHCRPPLTHPHPCWL